MCICDFARGSELECERERELVRIRQERKGETREGGGTKGVAERVQHAREPGTGS